MGNGPNNKWSKYAVSATADANAETSDQVLEFLNDYPINAATTVVCSDGTFVFVGYYKTK